MTAMRLKRYPSPSGGIALGKMGVGATMMVGGWRNPYVTNGLVAMWDVEWNAGGGKHDASIGKAVNLADSEIGEAVISSNYWTIGDKVATMDTATSTRIAYPSKKWYEDNMLASDGYTMEIVCSVKSFYTQNPNIMATADLNGIGAMRADLIGFWASNTNQGSGSYTSVSYHKASLAQGLHYFALSVSIGTKSLEFYDGNSWTTTINNGITGVQYYAYNRNKICLGCHTVSSEPQIAGWQFATARLHNRALTADEIAANYAVDKERFNLP